ncbi:hypothetical protein ACLOJK_038336 [Asimina triloba]
MMADDKDSCPFYKWRIGIASPLLLAFDRSTPRDVGVVTRNTTSLSGEAKSPCPKEGAAARVAEPGASGSDGHSLVGQHVLDKPLAPHEVDIIIDLEVELIGFLELVQLLTVFHDCWRSYLEMAASSPSLVTVREADHQLSSGAKILHQLAEKRDAEVANFEARIIEIDAEMNS